MNITKIINIIKYAMVIGEFLMDLIAKAESLFTGEKRGVEKKQYVLNEIKNIVQEKGASPVIANELGEFIDQEIDSKVALFNAATKLADAETDVETKA